MISFGMLYTGITTVSLSSYECRVFEPEQLVLDRFAMIEETPQNRPQATALLITLAVLWAQEGKTTSRGAFLRKFCHSLHLHIERVANK